jgi:hypothetical protein
MKLKCISILSFALKREYDEIFFDIEERQRTTLTIKAAGINFSRPDRDELSDEKKDGRQLNAKRKLKTRPP